MTSAAVRTALPPTTARWRIGIADRPSIMRGSAWPAATPTGDAGGL